MREITARKNDYIKELRSLKERKYRDRLRKYLIEGDKVVSEALRGAVLIESVITSDPENAAAKAAEERGLDVILVPDDVLRSISDVKTPQPVAACLLMQEAEIVDQKGLIVCVDNVQDPRNLGAIIRTADAAGAVCAVISPDSADPYGPKCQRAAMGSMFHIPVIREELGDYLRRFKAAGGQVVAGMLDGGSSLGEIREKVCAIVGNEARGVGETVRSMTDIAYRIPIYGQAESLNAAVAAGIILYDIRRNWKG